MKRLIFWTLTTLTIAAYGQGAQEKILYVVDSIPIMTEPKEEEGTLLDTDVSTVTVVTDKTEIEKKGFKDFDKVIFIITKEFANRPDDLRRIPTTKTMENRNEKWYAKNSSVPYTGPFIDYYYSGHKWAEGIIKNGSIEGQTKYYHQNGDIKNYITFINGKYNGESSGYFQGGQINYSGNYKDGKNDGLWKYWYSTGKLKEETLYKDGQTILTDEQKKFYKFFRKAMELLFFSNYNMAIKTLGKAIELSPDRSDAHFCRGLAYSHQSRLDEAIHDFNIAIDIEPLEAEALSGRAFARLKKYGFKDDRLLRKNRKVTVVATSSKIEIPKEELEKVCSDLNKVIQLGDRRSVVLETLQKYCE